MNDKPKATPPELSSGAEGMFDALLEATVDAIIVIDDVGSIMLVNQAALTLFGYQRDELVGANVSCLMPEPYAEEHDSYLARYGQTGERRIIGLGREVTARKKDGTIFPADLAVGESHWADRKVFVGIVRDISKRRDLEVEVRRRESELRDLFAGSSIPTLSTTTDGVVVRANRSCSQVLGYSNEEIVGRSMLDFCEPGERDELEDILERVGTDPLTVESHRCLTADGRTRIGSLQLSAYSGGRGERLLAIQFVDRTHELEVEREAAEARQRMAHMNRVSTLGEMAAAIAHEVNQPLGAIANYAQACRLLLERDAVSPERHAEILDSISEQAQRAGDVIRRLRALVRKGASQREVLDVNEVVREVSSLVGVDARLMGIPIVLDLVEPLPPLLADPIQLQQVTLNLMRNGLDSMRDIEGSRALLVASRVVGGEIEVSVTDGGTGVDPELADSIMSPFVSSKESGMGMGLAISQSLVSAHGGRLYFEPNPVGEGTRFAFRLPVRLDAGDADETDDCRNDGGSGSRNDEKRTTRESR